MATGVSFGRVLERTRPGALASNSPVPASCFRTVAGLAGTGLVLQNNLGDDLALTTNGSFTFATPLARGSSYSVTVKTQPSVPILIP